MSDNNRKYSGPIAWMVQNHVTANLLMIIIIIGGLLSAKKIKQEVFPEFDLDLVVVTFPYPGASPSEVEQGILLMAEEAINGLDGIDDVVSTAKDGIGSLQIELLNSANPDRVLSDVKNEIDRITNFPEDMKEPSVSLASMKRPVVSLIISGDEGPEVLHGLAEKVRHDLLREKDISQVDIGGVKPLEISIEISRDNLESYGLSIEQVSQQIKRASVDIPGGAVKSKGGNILVKVADRKLKGEEFKNIVIKNSNTGSEVLLGDIATINDGYEDIDLDYRFNGKQAVMVTAYRVGKETPIAVANAVKKYIKREKKSFPKTVKLVPWDDDSVKLKSRISLLVKNAMSGLILVIIVLSLFLQKRIAMWVALGIPISFLGTFLLMPVLGASINMITLFALIITLGMVVDDAIVIAENVYHKMSKGIPPIQAAIEGAQEMIMPVTFSILTTVVAFFPLMMIPGIMGKIFFLIPVIVILVLLFSWLESFVILPAHLAHGSEDGWIAKHLGWLDNLQEKTNKLLANFIENRYEPTLRTIIRHRYIAIASAFAIFLLVIGTLPAGILKFRFFPRVEGNVVAATVILPYGVPLSRTTEVSNILLKTAKLTIKDMDKTGNSRGIFEKIGQVTIGGGPTKGVSTGSHLLTLEVDLGPSTKRKFGSQEFANAWKKRVPPIAGVKSLLIASKGGPQAGKEIDFNLVHNDINILGEASIWLTNKLHDYSDLTNIENSFTAGQQQLEFTLKPGAAELGISSVDISKALRNSFYGSEATKEQRGRNELTVMVRLPKKERLSEYDIDRIMVSTSKGDKVPILSVANIKRTTSPTEIIRENSERVVSVSADVKPGTLSGNQMMAIFNSKPKDGESLSLVDELYKRFPGIRWHKGGQQKEQAETGKSMGPNFLFALLLIYTLLAIPFKSYIQPIIVMTAIPFGVVGAFIGHLLLGYDLSIMSVMGIIALSGVVVNDSLVLVDAVNKYRNRGLTVTEALITAGKRRFRPIMLTSVTTFFGLLPMIFEPAPSAKFLIPMAISLGFGILFVTFIVLLLIPALYITLERILYHLGFVKLEDI